MIHSPAVAHRFWNKVNRSDPCNCWLWTASRQRKGYGQFSINGKPQIATRIAFELEYGDIPAGMFVCHWCDNPSCVNPSHLFLGSPADNIHDMDAKGRRVVAPQIGSRHGCAKLNEASVAEIKARIASGEMQKRLALEFGVTPGAINHVAKGRQWKHVPGGPTA